MSLLMWMRAVRDHRPKPGAGSARYPVLWGLALRMRPDGSGFVTQQMLADDVETSDRTVRRHIKWAIDTGYLLRTRRGHRITNETAIASEYRLCQPDTGDLLGTEPTGNGGPPNRKAEPTQPDTGDLPRESSTRDSSPSGAKRAPERDLLARAGAVGDEIDEILERIQNEHHPRYLNAWLKEVARNGDLAAIIADVRARRRRDEARWAADARKVFPDCPHGEPGGDQPHPATGRPWCPLCRAERQSA